MTIETRQSYSEICEILKYLPQEYVKKVPSKLIELFKSQKQENYIVNIDKSNPLDKNSVSKKTMVIIAMLNYQYWCPNKKQKDNLFKTYSSNNKKYEEEIDEKYSIDKIFESRKNMFSAETVEKSVSLVEYKEQRWYEKLFARIRKIFKK